ncbi:uncharacterized protein C8R40DRAFT_1178131 [Lentinula edodes]|uniref:uncharacterized protein n=1 Tax=Lentinula edodes TaxID=5353 RepID=UPI001E8D089B|nr:uncharacterized protein C8R40DRAFT_1178131 [Lentinula edodes]KAH7868193.1 hypothetical protein C8R40DRAFT_1178131 [Lentinula edodes]
MQKDLDTKERNTGKHESRLAKSTQSEYPRERGMRSISRRFSNASIHRYESTSSITDAPAGATIPVSSLVPLSELPNSFDYSGFLSSMNPPSGPMTDELNTEENSLTPVHPFHNLGITQSSTSSAAHSREDPCRIAVRDNSEDPAIFSPAPLPSRRLSALRLTFILN